MNPRFQTYILQQRIQNGFEVITTGIFQHCSDVQYPALEAQVGHFKNFL